MCFSKGRNMRQRFTRALAYIGLVLIIPFSLLLRSPYLLYVRYTGLVFCCLLGAALVVWWLRRNLQASQKKKNIVFLLGALVLLLVPGARELSFRICKQRVLSTAPERLNPYSRHLILGYRSLPEIERLVGRIELGGIFISAHNVRGKTASQIGAEIAHLQRLQRQAGYPPLLVAVDQEGGMVSRVTPPLPVMANLSRVVADSNADNWRQNVADYATDKGRALRELGVNLNFSPVVDLKSNVSLGVLDLHSMISQRAISHDPDVTARVAAVYCRGLHSQGVLPVAKHFPGLGRVRRDTHHFPATLDVSREVLLQSDWVPFAYLAQEENAAVMVGHVVVPMIDGDNLASSSSILVQDILRDQLGHGGLVVTDDYTMSPVNYSWDGVAGKAAKSLAAGVDLILISFDPQLVYPLLEHMLEQTVQPAMQRSFQRIQRTKRSLERRSVTDCQQGSHSRPLLDCPQNPPG